MNERIYKNEAPAGKEAEAGVSLIDKVRLRIGLVLALRNLLRFLTVWALVLGVVILILRVILSISAPALVWTIISIVPGILWVIFVSFRAIPGPAPIRALLDERNRCGGLLMTGAEVPLESWQEKLPVLTMPAVKWQGGRHFWLLALSIGFVLGSLLVPQRYMTITSARSLDIQPDIEKLAEQVNTIQEANIISDEQAQNLIGQLEQLNKESSGYDPAKTWEALDHLRETLNKQAEQAEADALDQMQSLNNAETLAQGLSEAGSELPEELSSQAMAQLGEMMQDLALDDEMLKNALSSETLNALKGNQLSPEQLKEILAALKAGKGNISQKVGKLCKAGLADPNSLAMCQGLSSGDTEGLIAFLKENADMGVPEAIAAYCNNPGRGGVTRGRADAPMTWGDESDKEGSKFKEQVLPPATLEAFKNSMKIGISREAPASDEQGETSSGGALDSAAAGGGEAFTQKILPRHRGVVKRYFEREQQQQK